MSYSHYLALGDSMSIDRYPALDLSEGRFAQLLRTADDAPVGAASLLYVNDDDLWPEFEGRDLATLHPGIRKQDLAEDGATTGDVFIGQLPHVTASPDETLLTMTIGGNDLLTAYAGRHGRGVLERVVHDVSEAIALIVERLGALLPNATLLLSTVYDPSDGTGKLPGVFGSERLPLQYLDELNERIRELATRTPWARLADVHRHFVGHGVTAPVNDRWYWRHSIIEPGVEGASEIRRVWLEGLAISD